MRKGTRYLYMSYVPALLDSDVSFDDPELRRHHAVYKPGRGNWDGPFRDGNNWTCPGPPTEPYPLGFGRSALSFAVGDRVEVEYDGDCDVEAGWYPGFIVAANGETYDVKYDDDDFGTEENVAATLIRRA